MASMARNPRDIIQFESNPEYQRLSEQHKKYESELHRIATSQYLSSEDLLEEIKLKKLKLHVKDEMQQVVQRLSGSSPGHSQ
jgi:uncharacterized protein YdcH (DUF465 family)